MYHHLLASLSFFFFLFFLFFFSFIFFRSPPPSFWVFTHHFNFFYLLVKFIFLLFWLFDPDIPSKSQTLQCSEAELHFNKGLQFHPKAVGFFLFLKILLDKNLRAQIF